jgi:hypothetical protein
LYRGGDEILVTVPGSFIASQDEPGIGRFLSRRRAWRAASRPARGRRVFSA